MPPTVPLVHWLLALTACACLTACSPQPDAPQSLAAPSPKPESGADDTAVSTPISPTPTPASPAAAGPASSPAGPAAGNAAPNSLAAVSPASPPPVIPQTDIRLTNVTAESGIDFRHTEGAFGEAYIVEGMASGIVTFDFDQDGWVDIYFLNGAPLGKQAPQEPSSVATNKLYRNLGDGRFEDVTEAAGVGDTGFALGGAAADYDGDGDLDLYVTNFGANVLYRNDGDGQFTDVTEAAGVAGIPANNPSDQDGQVGAGCSFFDKDNDGDLDLYVAKYVNFTYDNFVPVEIRGHRFQAGPQYYDAIPDILYENQGDGTFVDVTTSSGVAAVAGPGMATLAWDFDEDGDQDVYVCNDGQPNYLFVNDGTGHFSEQGVLAGLAYDFNGKANASMGVDLADYNGDGQLDLFVTDYQAEMPVLYQSLGSGLFEDKTTSAKIDNALFAHVHWGTAFVDFDNDGDKDLFIACGHFDPIELIDDRTAKNVRNYLLMNQGNGSFVDVSLGAGDGLQVVASSRGAAFDDFDNDGDIDVVVVNSADAPTILRNDSVTKHHWLELELKTDTKNTFAVGATVKVSAGGNLQKSVVLSGRGYQSYFGSRLHFGLGAATTVEFIEVVWPDSTVERFQVEGVDRRIELRQGSGPASQPLSARPDADE